MTETRRRNHGRGHSYLLDGQKVPGVTTLINGGFPKNGLIKWAGDEVAAHAVDNWESLGLLPVSQRLKTLEKVPNQKRDAGALRGTRVHKLADLLTRGEEVEVPAELAGHVGACVRFLDSWEIDPLLVEQPVFSREHQYAGSPDLFGKARDGRTWLFDWKTNAKGPYGDMAFQLAAYRYAEFFLGETGDELPVPPVDEAAVVWLRADGYDVIPFETGPEVFRQFLYISEVARAAELCRDYMGEAVLLPGGSA